MSSIGSRIREKRERKGMTQDELAIKVGYKSRSSINKIEIGQRNLSPQKLQQIAVVLDTTYEYLLDGSIQYTASELIELYAKGAQKWASDFRFSEKQKSRIQEWLADSVSRLKSVVEAMANSDKENDKIVMDDILASSLESNAHWARNAVSYVNGENFVGWLPKDEETLLKMYRQLNPQGKEYILQTILMATQVYTKNASAPDLESSAG